MTDDPPDPAISKAVAAYRSAGNLRAPAPAPRIVRLVDEPGQSPSPQAVAPTAAPDVPAPASIGAPDTAPAKGVSLMITNVQKDSLRRLGVSEDAIRDMTPAEAHRRLGLSGRG